MTEKEKEIPRKKDREREAIERKKEEEEEKGSEGWNKQKRNRGNQFLFPAISL